MNEAAAASGYPWVMGSDVVAPAATLFDQPNDLENQLLVTFDTPAIPAYDNAGVSPDAVLGQGQQRIRTTSTDAFRMTGLVIVSAEWMAGNSVDATRDLALHEIGHTFGLAHFDAPDELMHPAVDPAHVLTRYGAGDAAGLALLRAHSLINC
jgi:Matrixin